MASKALAGESNELDHMGRASDRQAAAAFGERLRARATELGLNKADLGRAAGIPKQSMTGYWEGKRLPGSERLFPLSDALQLDARWLVSGSGQRTAGFSVRDAAEADWVDVPEFDLREITDASRGAPLMSVPVRRDWLYSTFRTSSGLWLARLLSDYDPAGLTENTLVICRDVRREELAQGHICLWRVRDSVVIGRFSVVPDTSFVQGRPNAQGDPRLFTPYLDPALGIVSSDLLVPPSRIAGPGSDGGDYHLVGRILGTMIRPL